MASVTTLAVSAIIGALDHGSTLGAIAVVGLVLLLTQRELASVAGDNWRLLAHYSALATVPLVVVFAMIVMSRLSSLL